MILEIPVEVDLNGIDGIVNEIKCLQKYKLSEGDDMELVSLDDVAEILINHIEVRRESKPQRMRGKWIPIQRGFFNKEVTQVKCDQCGNLLDLIGVNCGRGDANFCPNCGCQMCGGEEDE